MSTPVLTRYLLFTFGVIAVIATAAILILSNGDETPERETRLDSDSVPITTPSVLRYANIARAIWGNVCDGHVSVAVVALGRSGGQASWIPSSDDRNDPNLFASCTVVINRTQRSPQLRCAIVVHEYGHLAGHEHSANRRSVMYPSVRLGRNVPPECQ